jgi:hypothetical protein
MKLIPRALAKVAGSALLAVTLAAPMASQAADPFLYVGMAMSARNTTGADRTDFHVEMGTDTDMTFKQAVLKTPDGNLIPPSNITGNGTHNMTLDGDVNTKEGQSIRWQAAVWEKHRNYIYFKSWFTPKQSPTDVPSLGWRVEDNGDVFLTNAYAEAIHFSGLSFSSANSFTSDSLFDLIDGDRTGLQGVMTTGTVSGLTDLYVGHFAGPSVQHFLYAVFDTRFVDEGFSQETASIALVHEVPEPSSVALVVSGLVSLAWLRRKQGQMVR